MSISSRKASEGGARESGPTSSCTTDFYLLEKFSCSLFNMVNFFFVVVFNPIQVQWSGKEHQYEKWTMHQSCNIEMCQGNRWHFRGSSNSMTFARWILTTRSRNVQEGETRDTDEESAARHRTCFSVPSPGDRPIEVGKNRRMPSTFRETPLPFSSPPASPLTSIQFCFIRQMERWRG